MIRLLNAGFCRLWRNHMFWGCMMAMFLFGVLCSAFPKLLFDTDTYFENLFFFHTIPIALISAVFCSLFLGAEHSDGTLRNKLVTGYDRRVVYISCFLVCFIACLLMCAAFLVPACIFGIPRLGFFVAPWYQVVIVSLSCLLVTGVWCALYSFVCLCCHNKAVNAIVCLLLVFVFFVLAFWLTAILDEHKMIYEIVGFDSAGQPLLNSDGRPVHRMAPNPLYIDGALRECIEFLRDLLPSGQALQYTAAAGIRYFYRKPLISLCTILVCTLAGTFIFQKKDIR